MTNTKYTLCLIALMAFALPATATASNHTTFTHQAPTDETISKLAKHITWQRLLLYPDGKTKSMMPDADFFISPTGRTNPEDELVASLNELLNPQTQQTFACRYPARTHWLSEQLGITPVSCGEFDAWAKKIDTQKISLVHAEEHINRVGSSFAHTLLRLDSGKSLATGQAKYATSLNFATAEGHDTLLGSILGTNPAEMTLENYEKKQNNYLKKDGRDIWQYELDLTQSEIDQIIRHAWETKNAKRYYNFLNNNCATEVLRFVDLVRPNLALYQTAGGIVSPIEATQVMADSDIITKTTFIPADKTLTQTKLNGYDGTPLPSRNNPADDGTKAHRLSIYTGRDDEDFIGLTVRGAYQDLLDRPVGKRDYLSVQIMSADLRHHDNKTRLHEATLADILALNPIGSSYAGTSWGGHAKLTNVVDASHKDNDEHLVLSVGGEYGYSVSFGKTPKNTGQMPNTLCYALGTGTAQVGKLDKGQRFGMGIHAGCVHHISERWRVLADGKLPYWYNGQTGYWQPTMSSSMQYDLSPSNAIRFSHQWQKNHDRHDNSWQMSYLRYF